MNRPEPAVWDRIPVIISFAEPTKMTETYFFNPNGLRVELTTRTESEGFLEEVARTAHDDLADWTAKRQQQLTPAETGTSTR